MLLSLSIHLNTGIYAGIFLIDCITYLIRLLIGYFIFIHFSYFP